MSVSVCYKFPQHGYDDVLHMSTLTIDSFLENIQTRYQNELYYTYIGEVCISVNPNRPNMSIYGPDYMNMYHNASVSYNLPPHIFAIASSAYRKIFEKDTDCSIIITGESGSGKTEASKLLFLYISYVQKNETLLEKKISNVESLIIRSNHILEAFGNAQTISNENSSRFGKYTEISFVRGASTKRSFQYELHSNLQYSYGTIFDYLLEKCRVIEQQEGERNFHAFYQFLSVLNSEKYQHLFFEHDLDDNVQSYRYLNGSSKSQVTIQDRINFDHVYDSMIKIGFTILEIESIYKVLASILILGNIQFELPEDQKDLDFEICLNNEKKFLEKFCRLMSLDVVATLKTLCSRLIRTPFESVRKPYNVLEAKHGRDALAKAIYQKLFSYILKRINYFLKINKCNNDDDGFYKTNTIGILDIYGFEVFNTRPNGFEQFLINYCNEKLHQLFIDLIMKKEQDLYKQEDIQWTMILYDDNNSICQLMDETNKGIFALLDEACTSGQAYKDQDLLKILSNRLIDNKHFRSRFSNPSLKNLRYNTDFIIRHFAGDVHYSIEGFIEKNLDQLYYDYSELLQTIDNPSIRKIFENEKQSDNKRPVTIGYQFRKSMESLIPRLSQRQQLYVRCIKPTVELNSINNRFNVDKVRHQIQYLGLVENAKIRKAGFWRQFPYDSFVRRFQMLLDKQQRKSINLNLNLDGDLRMHFKPICEEILQKLEQIDKQRFDADDYKDKFAFGKTILFLRDPQILESLEMKRFQFLQDLIFKIQYYGRRRLAMNRFELMKLSKSIFELWYQQKKLESFDKLSKQFQKNFEQYKSICLHRPMQYLEYYDLKPFISNVDTFDDDPLLRNNVVYTKILPELTAYLNRWLVILKFPYSYWNEKSLRIEASKIFKGNKSEWGNLKHRWLANYLVESAETEHYDRFYDFFARNNDDFHDIIFSSYMIKTNLMNMNQICAMVMNRQTIFKVNIDQMTYKEWISMEDIKSISVTTGRDQLVVLHHESKNKDDLVFTFCSIKNTAINSNNARLDYDENAPTNENKIGEFVTLLKQTYELFTGSILKINFLDNIEFNWKGHKLKYQIKAIEIYSPEFMNLFNNSGLMASFSKLLNIKKLWRLYLTLKTYKNHVQHGQQNQLAKQVKFRKVSKNKLVLIYE